MNTYIFLLKGIHQMIYITEKYVSMNVYEYGWIHNECNIMIVGNKFIKIKRIQYIHITNILDQIVGKPAR